MNYKIIKTEDSVIVEKDGKRYEVYFDCFEYAIFVGEPGMGALIKLDRGGNGKLEFWRNW